MNRSIANEFDTRRINLFWYLAFLSGLIIFTSNFAIARKPIGDLPKESEKNQVQKWMIVRQTINGKESKKINGHFLMFTKRGMMEHHAPKGKRKSDSTMIYRRVFYRYRGVGEISQIDMAGKSDWSDIEQGITTIKDGLFYVCYNKKGQGRPENFATGNGDGNGYILTIYKRVKIE